MYSSICCGIFGQCRFQTEEKVGVLRRLGAWKCKSRIGTKLLRQIVYHTIGTRGIVFDDSLGLHAASGICSSCMGTGTPMLGFPAHA